MASLASGLGTFGFVWETEVVTKADSCGTGTHVHSSKESLLRSDCDEHAGTVDSTRTAQAVEGIARVKFKWTATGRQCDKREIGKYTSRDSQHPVINFALQICRQCHPADCGCGHFPGIDTVPCQYSGIRIRTGWNAVNSHSIAPRGVERVRDSRRAAGI